jgi:hypothetical protein
MIEFLVAFGKMSIFNEDFGSLMPYLSLTLDTKIFIPIFWLGSGVNFELFIDYILIPATLAL